MLKLIIGASVIALFAPLMLVGEFVEPDLNAVLLCFMFLWWSFGLLFFAAFYKERPPKLENGPSLRARVSAFWSIGFEWFAIAGFLAWAILGVAGTIALIIIVAKAST